MASSPTFSSRSDMTVCSDMSITTTWERIGTILCSIGKRPQINWSMYDVPSNCSTASLSTIPIHARAYRSPSHMYRDMGPCKGTGGMVTILVGGALTSLTCDRQFGGRSELLERIGPALVSSRLATVRCVLALMPTEIRTRYVGF